MIYKFFGKIFKVFLLRVFSLNIYLFNKRFLKTKMNLLNSFHTKNMNLANHIAVIKAKIKLPNKITKIDQDIIYVWETATYIAENNHEELGITDDEADDYLLTFFESFDEKIGITPIFLTNCYLNYSDNLIKQITDNFTTNIISSLSFYNLLLISEKVYSPRIQKEVFKPIIADWQEEYFEALFKKEIWKARWINVRYTYAFLAAMWQKSPIGDLIEFVVKIAKG